MASLHAFQKLMAPLSRRMANLFIRGKITRVNDTEGLQIIQSDGRDGENYNGVERFQPFGLTASPPDGSHSLLMCVGGRTDHPICIGAEDPETRKAAIANVETVTTLAYQPGDVLLYCGNNNFALLRAESGNLIIHSPETLRLNAKNIEIHADENLYVDAGGTGFHYTAATIINYMLGITPTTVSPAPPDIRHPNQAK